MSHTAGEVAHSVSSVYVFRCFMSSSVTSITLIEGMMSQLRQVLQKYEQGNCGP